MDRYVKQLNELLNFPDEHMYRVVETFKNGILEAKSPLVKNQEMMKDILRFIKSYEDSTDPINKRQNYERLIKIVIKHYDETLETIEKKINDKELPKSEINAWKSLKENGHLPLWYKLKYRILDWLVG